MPEKHLPFMLSALASSGLVPVNKINTTRIVEAIIIAVLTAGATTWAATRVLETQVVAMDKRLDKVERQEYDGRVDILASVNEVRGLVLRHLEGGK